MVVWEALDALSHQLELCRIGPETRVAVIVAEGDSSQRCALIRAAVARSGAEAVELRPIRSTTDDAGFVANLIDGCDVVIATQAAESGWLPDSGAGRATVLVLADIEPQDYPPHANLRRRTLALRDSLKRGDSLNLSDPHGTRLRLDLAGGLTTFDHGLLDGVPRAAYPAGWVRVQPSHGRANGTVVLMPGDAIVTAARLVSSPVRLEIIDDHISSIDGDNADADVLRAYLEYADDQGAYGVAGLTVGMNPGTAAPDPFDARLTSALQSRLLAGVVSLSFGENLTADRPCSQTVTLALPGRSLTLDGLPAVASGSLTGDFAPDVYEL